MYIPAFVHIFTSYPCFYSIQYSNVCMQITIVYWIYICILIYIYIYLPSGKLTSQWNIPIFNRKYIFKGSIFHWPPPITGIWVFLDLDSTCSFDVMPLKETVATKPSSKKYSKILKKLWQTTYQLAQDLFHQQYFLGLLTISFPF